MKRALILAGGGARGAFQAGVLQYLEEIGWKPDMLCGNSVGAVNAVALGSGISAADLGRLWKRFNRKRIFKLTSQKFIMSFLSGRKFHPLMDTGPLRAILGEYIDTEALKKNRTKIIITAVNMLTSEVKYFDNSVITVNHVMASGAMPMLFPCQFIDGEPYWDGCVTANVPIMPALESGAKEILVVLLSPVGAFRTGLPRTHAQAGELILEQFMIGSYMTLTSNYTKTQRSDCRFTDSEIKVIAPRNMLGLGSLLNFSEKQSVKLIQEGYTAAKEQLGSGE